MTSSGQQIEMAKKLEGATLEFLRNVCLNGTQESLMPILDVMTANEKYAMAGMTNMPETHRERRSMLRYAAKTMCSQMGGDPDVVCFATEVWIRKPKDDAQAEAYKNGLVSHDELTKTESVLITTCTRCGYASMMLLYVDRTGDNMLTYGGIESQANNMDGKDSIQVNVLAGIFASDKEEEAYQNGEDEQHGADDFSSWSRRTW